MNSTGVPPQVEKAIPTPNLWARVKPFIAVPPVESITVWLVILAMVGFGVSSLFFIPHDAAFCFLAALIVIDNQLTTWQSKRPK